MESLDKYIELLKFEMEETDILYSTAYELNDEDKVPIIRKLFRREGLKFIPTTMNSKKEACKTAGLFKMLNEKFKAQHKETIL